MTEPAHLFPLAPAFGFEPLPGSAEWGGGGGVFRGANPPAGARIDVWVSEFTGDPLAVSIKGTDGRGGRHLSRVPRCPASTGSCGTSSRRRTC